MFEHYRRDCVTGLTRRFRGGLGRLEVWSEALGTWVRLRPLAEAAWRTSNVAVLEQDRRKGKAMDFDTLVAARREITNALADIDQGSLPGSVEYRREGALLAQLRAFDTAHPEVIKAGDAGTDLVSEKRDAKQKNG